MKKLTPRAIKSRAEARTYSLWVINYFTACGFMELLPWVGSGYDMERFGIMAVSTPRHADVLVVSGYVTKKAVKRIKMIYDQMPSPKYVLALGSCPMTGGMYWRSGWNIRAHNSGSWLYQPRMVHGKSPVRKIQSLMSAVSSQWHYQYFTQKRSISILRGWHLHRKNLQKLFCVRLTT